MEPKVARTYGVLFASAILVCLLELTPSRLTPPGNAWSRGDHLALVALLVGSFIAARFSRALVIHVVYGSSTATIFWLVLGPDRRDLLAIGAGSITWSYYLWRYIIFVAGAGIVCGGIARITHAICDARRIESGHCKKCGYDLTGNVSGVCPECGTPIGVGDA